MIDYNELEVAVALDRLRPKSKYVLYNGELNWQDTEQSQPSEEDILAEIATIKEEKVSKQYKVDRSNEYPNIKDQLDMLWHEVNTSGTISNDGQWFNSIKGVKDAHPKP